MAARRPGGGTPATTMLAAAGIEFEVCEYEHDPRATSYGLEAAERLGLAPEQVFKTLLVDVDASTVVAIVPVSGSLDLKALAAAAGGRRADLTDPDRAQRLTGYVIGGISPIGQRRLLPTFVDTTAEGWERVYVSGGRRGMDLGLAPGDLIAVTSATVAAIGRAT
jgi:Cys-tRNA(Pro)/Cys-tRNA(Cys) deacylase